MTSQTIAVKISGDFATEGGRAERRAGSTRKERTIDDGENESENESEDEAK